MILILCLKPTGVIHIPGNIYIVGHVSYEWYNKIKYYFLKMCLQTILVSGF